MKALYRKRNCRLSGCDTTCAKLPPAILRFSRRTAGLAGLVLLLSTVVAAHEDVDRRIADLDVRIAASPRNLTLYIDRAELFRARRDWGFAHADLQQAAALVPHNVDLYFYRGRLWLEAGRPERAEPELTRFLATKPNHPQGLLVRARVRAALGRRLAAAGDLSRAIAVLHRPTPELYLERARLLVAEGGIRVNEAVRGIDEAVAQLGPLVSLVEFAVETESQRGHYDAALARIEQLPETVKGQARWQKKRGDILRLADRKTEAQLAYASALASLQALSEKRRQTRAIQELEAAIKISLRKLSAVDKKTSLSTH